MTATAPPDLLTLVSELGALGILPAPAGPLTQVEDMHVGQLLRAARAAKFEVSLWSDAEPHGEDFEVIVSWTTDPERPLVSRESIDVHSGDHEGATFATVLGSALVAAAKKRSGA